VLIYGAVAGHWVSYVHTDRKFTLSLANLLPMRRYQKQLQLNYVQMYKKNKTLETEIDQGDKMQLVMLFWSIKILYSAIN
jgi:hypothetical protein